MDDAITLHRELQGKINTGLQAELTEDNLKLLYTPGVGKASMAIADDPMLLRQLTLAGRTVAVVSDGSAVLGLGNIGAGGALPVMEGKALLFKSLGGVDAFPICLDTQDSEEIIKAVKVIAPNFAGINLEDISAPKCYEIERRLQAELDIPVMHDDQHATAIIVLAGLINALKVADKKLEKAKIVIVGAGAAGNALTHLLSHAGATNLIVCDSKGILASNRTDLDQYKTELVAISNKNNVQGNTQEACEEADVIIGLSGPGAITTEYVQKMNDKAVVFALANPVPEIMPGTAKEAGAYIIATGRSDFPNQLNNVLVFPGIFRAMIEQKVPQVTNEIKLATAAAIASLVPKPTPENIIPSAFDDRVVPTILETVKQTLA